MPVLAWASNLLATIKDGRNTVYLTNTYQNGRIATQGAARQTILGYQR